MYMSTDPTLSRASDPDATGLPEQPDARGPVGGDAGAQEGPISERVGRDPGNLGDEVPAPGDLTTPSPEPSDLQM
jgi:hypothetical protein